MSVSTEGMVRLTETLRAVAHNDITHSEAAWRIAQLLLRWGLTRGELDSVISRRIETLNDVRSVALGIIDTMNNTEEFT